MGLLSGLFGRSHSSPTSFVRRWSDRRMRELRREHVVTVDTLFAGFITYLSDFAKPPPKREGIDEEEERLRLHVSTHYGGDWALFEVGCYTCFRLDRWLFAEHPELGGELLPGFLRSFTKLFGEALELPDIRDLLGQRLEAYSELARSEADIQTYHSHLTQLILRTEDNRKPEPYDFSNGPIMISDAFVVFALKLELKAWESVRIPALIESMAKLITLMK